MKPREWSFVQGYPWEGPEVRYDEKVQVIEKSAYDELQAALERIAAVTYGTKVCNTPEENNAILADHFFIHQNIAREALKRHFSEDPLAGTFDSIEARNRRHNKYGSQGK